MKENDAHKTGRMSAGLAQSVLTSRLLILQSKRLMLGRYQRKLDCDGSDEEARRRVEVLRSQTDAAQHAYRSVILAWGSPENAEYWIVAYGRLIDMGTTLTQKLRDAVAELPLAERYQVSADVESLESIVGEWTEKMRRSMAAAVA